MKKIVKYFIPLVVLMIALNSFAKSRGKTDSRFFISDELFVAENKSDSLTPRYPVKKTHETNYEDFVATQPIDLNTPSNIKTEIEYDSKSRLYIFRTKVGDREVSTPFSMSSDEYMSYTLKKSMAKYFKNKNAELTNGQDDGNEFSLKNIKLNLGPAERLFGPGGLQFHATGYVEGRFGIKHTKNGNPTLSEKNRSKMIFDFDEDIQLNVTASVGDKINFDMNYDTEAMFDFDSKRIKLAYDAAASGDDDAILRRIEAGNVSMATTNSLITGGSALFGITTELQFGKLRINAVVSQQEAEARSATTTGGIQKTPFELKADQYDENRHFFLAHYFRDNYDKAMSKLPIVLSPISITKLEVWITNKRSDPSQVRNIVAFADLGEADKIKNTTIWNSSNKKATPNNAANNLYSRITTSFSGARDISQVTSLFSGIPLEGGLDYEKVENARLLNTSEYFFNPQLGYISLISALQPDEVLAVAYTYIMGGKAYQVGELSTEISPPQGSSNNSNLASLFVKLIKPTSLSPASYSWDLMMKNVYNLGTTSIQEDQFRLEIAYRSDTLGTYINYLPEGRIKDKQLLRVVGLDKLNSKKQKYPDGIFDFLEGYTIRSQTGRVYFPVIEPFGKTLRDSIGNSAIADKYVFNELYEMTSTAAQQEAEKNKYIIRGSYRGSASDSEIDLNATNIPQGSVTVMAGGRLLTENVDYTVDYISGKVNIINQAILDANTPIQASAEGRSFSMQRKTLLGINLSYDFSKDFTIGGTLMHYYEKPMTNKATIGNESVKNTLWGLNTAYRKESMWLTNLVDKIPFVNAKAPSQINVNAEFAQMLPGHYQNSEMGGYSYLDDFETSESKIDIKAPYAWTLASAPSGSFRDGTKSFPEAKKSNDVEYGKNRAMLSWFQVDPLFTRKNSSLTPQHIKNDVNQLSNHFVREVLVEELYPKRDIAYNERATLPVLNLSYYPEERGPYNIVASNINSDGKLKDPKESWGGITRRMDVRDFETSNVEYIEFWLMDPFVYNSTKPNEGGELYINLGDISEDVLKDGKKFYENGLPVTGDLNDPSVVEINNWGKVPKRQSTIYAFDENVAGARKIQDVGINGLSTEEEFQHHSYANYLASLRNIISGNTLQQMLENPQSPLNDPAGDTYHFYRGGDYDRDEKSILDRYKFYNNTEGNSAATDDTNESFSTAARSTPDVEDIDQDNTLNETESYFQYKIDLRPGKMDVGKDNYIVDKREVSVSLRNGTKENITWYQFKIPIRNYESKTGTIQSFKSIRFMRMFLTDFAQETFLRFGTLQLVRGEWRVYEKPLNKEDIPKSGTIDVSTVNIEENSERVPVNYVLPPGLSRDLDPDQTQITKENEQSLSLRVSKLEPGDAKAIYKNTHYDLRRYKRIQLFTHLEELVGETELKQGDFTVFMRLGADYKNNYYEYEIPMSVTPHGTYSLYNNTDREIVWPRGNMFDLALDVLKNAKIERNKEMRINPAINFLTPYFKYDVQNNNNKITVMGNPSLSDVDVIMIGVRNNTRVDKSGEVWINELRLTDFDEEGGWAAQANVNLALSDLATINFSGRKETIGFGSLEQSLMERRQDDFETYNIATSVDLGRFIPEKAKVSVPFNFAFSKETITPKYDPFDKDITMKESLSIAQTKAEKDSINSLARERVMTKSVSFNNVRVNIASKTPMPYDPANFSFGYSMNKSETNTPTVVYDRIEDYKATMTYSYSPMMKTWEPFKKVKSKKGSAKFAKSIGINYLPNNIAFNSNISRYYTETVVRDIESYRVGADNRAGEFLSWSQSFYWDRDFNINWDFTRNLKFTFQSGTRAEIEEPYLQVNKKINRNDYEIWRDEVWRSIKSLGNPLNYKQTASVTYQLPFKNIPALSWITNSSVSYNSAYNWDRGAVVDTLEIGNTIHNQMTLEFNNRLNLVNLYNKSSFLKRVNERFDNRPRPKAPVRQRREAEQRKRRFKQTITLKKDTTVTLKHNLKTKDLDILALHGKTEYKLKYKKSDENTIIITNKDTVQLIINIEEKEKKEFPKWVVEVGEHSARALMSVRSLSINYSRRNDTYISGFKPHIGDFFGQKSAGDNGYAPGLGFAFGLQGGPSYVEKSLRRDWLVNNEMNINPAVYNEAEKLDIRAQIEPFRGMRIELNAARENNKRTEIQYMFDGSPRTLGGNFSITTISLASSFTKSSASNGYKSTTFDKFLNNRYQIKNRIEDKYAGSHYPSGGFMQDVPGLINKPYNPSVGEVNPNSPDVLIPAFLAAYTGKDANKVTLSAFPSLSSILPNWTLTYDGLIGLPFLKDKLKMLQITHSYQSFYQVGGYNSNSSWVGANDDLGYIRNVLTGDPIPSSAYDISTVSISEAFNPLFGVSGTLSNNLSFNAQFNRARVLNLNISAFQIVESFQSEFIVGAGYRINEFNRLIGLSSKKIGDFNNDLTLKVDISSRSNEALIRKIQENFTQATGGTTTFTIMFSADYSLSRALTLRAFFDRIMNKPLVSASAFPTTNTNVGISVRYTLLQ